MTTSIVKWGNSQGIRLPKHVLESADLTNNDIVEVIAKDGKIIIEKASVKKQHKTIQERFANFNEDYEPIDIEWGAPVGKEIW